MSEVLEIEHKFLLLDPPTEILIPSKRFLIQQTYLKADSKLSERVRYSKSLDDGYISFTHTIKRPGPQGGKWETEKNISQDEYIALLSRQKKEYFPIFKTRYEFYSANQLFELDHFIGPIEFYLLEAEVKSLQDPLDLNYVESFLGPLLSVTEDSRFSSSFISKKPYKTLDKIKKLNNTKK